MSLERWDQKWLSEGHATFYQRLWEAESGCDALGLEGRMRAIYERGQAVRDRGGPPDRPRSPRFAYDSTIYDQGALALYALRERVGEAIFADIEAAWLTRYADASASTDDFIALATEVAGTDLSRFLEDWLRGDELPPMPNHPDWVRPERLPARASRAAPDSCRARARGRALRPLSRWRHDPTPNGRTDWARIAGWPTATSLGRRESPETACQPGVLTGRVVRRSTLTGALRPGLARRRRPGHTGILRTWRIGCPSGRRARRARAGGGCDRTEGP